VTKNARTTPGAEPAVTMKHGPRAATTRISEAFIAGKFFTKIGLAGGVTGATSRCSMMVYVIIYTLIEIIADGL
jgi:hypothetical protein